MDRRTEEREAMETEDGKTEFLKDVTCGDCKNYPCNRKHERWHRWAADKCSGFERR